MIYIGLVDKIKDEHRTGIYGVRKLSNEEIMTTANDLVMQGIGFAIRNLIFPQIVNVALPLVAIGKAFNSIKKKTNKITLQHELADNEKKIIIKDSSLDGNYSVDSNAEIFYGLFDDIVISKNRTFEKMMKSQGGSTLVIMEKETAHKEYKHYGGNGYFSSGLYMPHPKDSKVLIPVKNANDIIKSFILEETIRAFEALGAKSIVIEDKTNSKANVGAKKDKISVNASLNNEDNILRSKEFGKGVFSPERALSDKLFIHDFPNIISVLEGRIHGNQLKEEFSERINLSAGLDVGVLNLFKANAGFNYERIWHFKVEFYDKNN